VLIKSGAGSFSMVGGFVLSAPRPQPTRANASNPLQHLLHQLLHWSR